jgi:CubicO group peptidase (beta-lactamase class C family)
MYWTRLIALATFTACAPAQGPAAAPPTDARDPIAARLAAELPAWMTAAEIPGLEIALVRDDRVVWRANLGMASAATHRPVTPTTAFEAASLSKPLFAYAVMKLVDAGQLDLDRPLASYLPAPYDAAPDPRFAQITARHVLTHTTGLPNWRQGELAIQRAPGTQFSYSGEGFVYLARVVEHITGQPFEAFMQHSVLEPLGMTHSGYAPPADHAARHDAWGMQVAAAPTPRDRNPAAGLWTTADDYARFVIAMWHGTGLSPAARALMLSPQVAVIDGGPGSLERASPVPRRDVHWGFGWALEDTAAGPAFWHWGDNGEAKAFVLALARPQLAVVVLADGVGGLSIVRAILGAVVPGRQPGLDWLGYESFDGPRAVLARAIIARGAEAALRDYRTGGSARISERELNSLGYQLATAHRIADAIAVLAQNASDHPASANTYDSLGEIYDLAGDHARAMDSYARSLALDPDNHHAAQELVRLRAAAP